MKKRLALVGLVFIFLTWCGCSQLAHFAKCDFENALVDRKMINEFYDALAAFEQQNELTLEYSGWPSCASPDFELYVAYYTPRHYSKYGIAYTMHFYAIYSESSKTIKLQYTDYDSDEIRDGLVFIESFRDILVDFESTAKVKELVDQYRYRPLYGSVSYDHHRVEISTIRAVAPLPDTGEYASISFSISADSIQSYDLPNHRIWSEFGEMTLAHQIIPERYLIGELASCTITTDAERYANTHVIYRSDVSTMIEVNISCPNKEKDGTLRLNLLPDGTLEYEAFL